MRTSMTTLTHIWMTFPALITGLYQSYGVPVAPSKVIRPHINRAFIKKYCIPDKHRVRCHSSQRRTNNQLQICHRRLKRRYRL